MEYVSKTQHYLKVKKPQLERQRRARINKSLDAIKDIIAELQNDETILRMDKAEMLEATIAHLRQTKSTRPKKEQVDGFRNGYINAANEVSRVLASTRGMNAELGKAVMIHLGCQFNRLHETHHHQLLLNAENCKTKAMLPLQIHTTTTAPLSPTSSGYHSDSDCSMASPATTTMVWRPW